jgi:tetratricopeptide (TPR) repeat protein
MVYKRRCAVKSVKKKNQPLCGSKIVPFEQSEAFFHRRAMKHADKANLTEALSFVRRAIAMDPKNNQYQMDMAGIYCDMGRVDLANRIFFRLLRKDTKTYADAYYGLGVNYANEQAYANAQGVLQRYLQLAPEGEYVYEAAEMLEGIYDMMDESDGAQDGAWQMYHTAVRARGMQQRGEYGAALEAWNRVDDYDPYIMEARNNITRILIEKQRYEAAAEAAQSLLTEDAGDVLALSNLLRIAHRTENHALKEQTAQKLCGLRFEQDMEDMDMLQAVCFALLEAGYPQEALEKLRTLLHLKPYDRQVLHAAASVHYNAGQYRRALYLWRRMADVDDEDTVARWYVTHAMRVVGGADPMAMAPYLPQVPMQETVRRIRRLNQALEDMKLSRRRWQDDKDFHDLVLWGLSLDERVRQSLAGFVAAMDDEEAAMVLEDMLVTENETDKFKNYLLSLLKQMGRPEPFIALLDGDIVEVRVSLLPAGMHVPQPYQQVIDTAASNMRALKEDSGYARTVLKLWERHISALEGNYPEIENVHAVAGALERCYRMHTGNEMDDAGICARYGVEPEELQQAFEMIKACLTMEDPDENN